MGEEYEAANACWNYKDEVSNLQWYLPAMGELGFMMVRLKEINDTLSMLGGVSASVSYYFWSSSEYSSSNAYYLRTLDGRVCNRGKHLSSFVRPFVAV